MTLPNLTFEQRKAFAELLGSKDQDVLREMLALVYDAAIKAQFDAHVGAALHERTEAPARYAEWNTHPRAQHTCGLH